MVSEQEFIVREGTCMLDYFLVLILYLDPSLFKYLSLANFSFFRPPASDSQVSSVSILPVQCIWTQSCPLIWRIHVGEDRHSRPSSQQRSWLQGTRMCDGRWRLPSHTPRTWPERSFENSSLWRHVTFPVSPPGIQILPSPCSQYPPSEEIPLMEERDGASVSPTSCRDTWYYLLRQAHWPGPWQASPASHLSFLLVQPPPSLESHWGREAINSLRTGGRGVGIWTCLEVTSRE